MRRKSGTFGNSRGVILIDLLLSIMIMVLLVPAVILCLGSMQGAGTFNEEVQDTIAEAQIRHILMIAENKEAETGMLRFTYGNQEMRLSFVNDHLILQPGTQIFFSAVDHGTITVKSNLVYAVYTRKGKAYEKVLGTLS